MDSWLFAAGSFVFIILLLVVIHELGHLGTANLFGIKVLEFGLGMPPRSFCFYTGRTTLLADDKTLCLNGAVADLKLGMVIRAMSGDTVDGRLTARSLDLPGAGRLSDVPGGEDLLVHEGRVREVGDGGAGAGRVCGESIVMSDAWLVNCRAYQQYHPAMGWRCRCAARNRQRFRCQC